MLAKPIRVAKAYVIRMGVGEKPQRKEVRDLMYSVSQPEKQKYTSTRECTY